MKTIVVRVDQWTLDLIDELCDSSTTFRIRSALVRDAIREYAARVQKRLEDDRDRAIMHENKELLDDQLEALISEQAGK